MLLYNCSHCNNSLIKQKIHQRLPFASLRHSTELTLSVTFTWLSSEKFSLKRTLLHKLFLLPLRTPIWFCLSLCPSIVREHTRSSQRHESFLRFIRLQQLPCSTPLDLCRPWASLQHSLDHHALDSPSATSESTLRHLSFILIQPSVPPQISWSTTWPCSPRRLLRFLSSDL